MGGKNSRPTWVVHIVSIYHRTSHMHPAGEEIRKFVQLYVVNSAEADDMRSGNTTNSNCDPKLMKLLDEIIRSINILAKT